MARIILLMLMLAPFSAFAADDGRISFLEQEVRNLQRQVQILARQVDEMRTRPNEAGLSKPAPLGAAPVANSYEWVNSAKWQKLHRGMSEVDVIGVLGAPTSMRDELDSRVLLYAMEVGSSGFLGGSVTLRDHAVVEVRAPTLQ